MYPIDEELSLLKEMIALAAKEVKQHELDTSMETAAVAFVRKPLAMAHSTIAHIVSRLASWVRLANSADSAPVAETQRPSELLRHHCRTLPNCC
jgi:hypothetical protein